MNKLLLLALLGVVLGGGLWMHQNPDGNVADLKNQTFDSLTRLKAGVDAGVGAIREQGEVLDIKNRKDRQVNARLEILEQALNQSHLQEEEMKAVVDAELDESRIKLAELDELVTSMASKVDKTRAGNDADNVRLNAIERRLSLLVRRLDEQTFDNEIEDLQGGIDSLQKRLQGLTNDISSQQAASEIQFAGIEEQTETLALRVATLAGAPPSGSAVRAPTASGSQPPIRLAISAGVDDRLAALEAKLANVNRDSRRIQSLSRQLEAARQKITELEASKEQSSRALTELADSMQDLQTIGESLSIDTIQAEIRDQLARAEARLEQNNDAAELQSIVSTTRSRIQTLEQRVQELPATSSEANQALQMQSELQSQIASLERRLESLSNADPELASTVKDVKARVDQLSARQEAESVEYKIYFDRNSADITSQAATVLNSFIAQEKNRTVGVSIFGFTDRSGSAAYNQQLALQRATNVRSYLIQNGLDYTKIKALSGLGEDAAAAVLPDEASDAEQRVVVLYSDQP